MNTAMNKGQVALARKDDLVVQEMPDEVLVYDIKSHKAHCLNLIAAFVWNHCDGRMTPTEIAGLMEQEWREPVGEDVVWMALKQLSKANLLQEQIAMPVSRAGMTRRGMMQKVGLGALLTPMVMTVIAPTAAQAATACVPNATGCKPNGNQPGNACISSSECCSCCCKSTSGTPSDAHCAGGTSGCL
jgi:hypothetical protein